MADSERSGDVSSYRVDDGAASDIHSSYQSPASATNTSQPSDSPNSVSNSQVPSVNASGQSSTTQHPRVIGGFAAMVDAFMSSFWQASLAQSRMPSNTTSQQSQVEVSPQTSQHPTQSDTSQINTEVEQDRSPTTYNPMTESSSISVREENRVDASQRQEATPAANDSETSTAQSQSTHAQSTIEGQANTNEDAPRTLYFRMPFISSDGHMATLAFQPGPIPIPPQQTGPVPTYGPDRPDHYGPERGNGRASGFHLPTAPIFVPLGASPLPFSFIFDTQTNTAWPIAAISDGPPGAMPTTIENQAGFIAGPPFHVALNISFGPPPQPEVPDPERAMRFVDSLEVADAELRRRMSRLGLGSIGDYGGRQDNEGSDGALGCGICLDEYPSEDRPEWIGGQASKDEEVVAVPCAGHHTLHRRCLYEWLAKSPPSEWTCPFCRAGLDKKKVDESSNSNNRQNANVPNDHSVDLLKKAEQEAKARSLRDEVRLREKTRGWRCDSPACLPRYPQQETEDEFKQTMSNRMVPLLPCRHKQHFDCLCTSMRVEQADSAETTEDEEDGEEEREVSADTESSAIREDALANDTVGKWVTCPTCRHEAWAELPMRKKSRRVAAAKAKLGSITEVDQEHRSRSHTGSCVSSPNLGSKRPLDMPISGARERARMQSTQIPTEEEALDGDSDRDVEAMLL